MEGRGLFINHSTIYRWDWSWLRYCSSMRPCCRVFPYIKS